ncbi:seryl-tRNA synthetase [Sinorhizobium meliloti]|uniref:hypothetical protein n=1 Tax=Rhizobium meliloti TaxID=382 RepID=UPI000FDC632D|nr:hypothetical protein [Sinorhizobium meliloti]RVH28170.1 hypothetical protein CN215_09925 [Sinorhizobium meliloti]
MTMATASDHSVDLQSSDFETFFRTLRLPQRPAEIATAAEKLKASKVERDKVQSQHQEAGKLLANQKLGEAPSVTHSDVDALGSQIAPAIAAEEKAQAEYDRLLSEYSSNIVTGLQDPLQRYQEAIQAKIEELTMVLSLGAVLHTESVAAKVKLPSKVPALCTHVMGQIAAARTILNSANR